MNSLVESTILRPVLILNCLYVYGLVWNFALCLIENRFNDTHREKLVLYWIQYKNSLKYKVGCLWHFSYVYTIH